MPLTILAIVLFFTAYAAFHSLTASTPFKNWLEGLLGSGIKRWYRLVYNVIAVITLLPLLLILAWLPDSLLYQVPAPWRWLMTAGRLIAAVGLVASLLYTQPLHFLGIRQLFTDNPESSSELVISGPYGWVRHPLYFFSLMLIWLQPTMTVNWFATFTAFTIYFYVGSLHEEKRLQEEFGADYAQYKKHVPMLFPWPNRYSQGKTADS